MYNITRILDKLANIGVEESNLIIESNYIQISYLEDNGVHDRRLWHYGIMNTHRKNPIYLVGHEQLAEEDFYKDLSERLAGWE